jgi:hypothetical protein
VEFTTEACNNCYYFLSIDFYISSFSFRKENEAKEAATGKKCGLPLSHSPTRTKAGQTAFRTARGQANTHG